MENNSKAFDNVKERIKNRLVDYPDFPKKGILFRYVFFFII